MDGLEKAASSKLSGGVSPESRQVAKPATAPEACIAGGPLRWLVSVEWKLPLLRPLAARLPTLSNPPSRPPSECWEVLRSDSPPYVVCAAGLAPHVEM